MKSTWQLVAGSEETGSDSPNRTPHYFAKLCFLSYKTARSPRFSHYTLHHSPCTDPSSSRFVLPDLTRGNKIPQKQKWGCRPDVHLTNRTCGFHLWYCLKIVLIHPSIHLAFSITQPLGLQSKQRCSNLLQLLWEIWRNWPKDKISTACPKI